MQIKNFNLYDSIHELPIVRYNAFNAALLVDVGVGSDMAAVKTHLYNLTSKLLNPDELRLEATNLIMGYDNIINGISYKSRCFAATVRSHKGKVYPLDLSSDDLDELVGLIEAELTYDDVVEALESIKKKLMQN